VESLDLSGVGEVTGLNHLQGNEPNQLGLSGFVDHTHAAARDFTQQFRELETTKESRG
jgi:hypothetical protein